MTTSCYGINPANPRAIATYLIQEQVPFRYDPSGRFKILVMDVEQAVADRLSSAIDDPMEWVFIMPHIGVFTKPEMEAKWEEDRKRTEENSAYWREWANSPG